MKAAGMLTVMLGFLAADLYVCWRIWQILPLSNFWKTFFAVLYLLGTVIVFAGFGGGLEKLPVVGAAVAYEYGNSVLIFFLYALIAFLLLDAGRILHLVDGSLLKDSAAGSAIVFGTVSLLLAYGGFHYHHKYREEMTIESSGISSPVRIVLASDLHLGYHNRRSELRRWVDMINAERPDYVLLAGDLIDISVRPLLKWNYASELRRLKAPVLACLGNHEYYAREPLAAEFYDLAGIRLLRDEAVRLGELTVIGRDDATNRNRAPLAGIVPEVEGFKLLLDHQPNDLSEAQRCGIDFQFSGHTHRGQVWPVSWVTGFIFEDPYGHMQKGRTRYYVTSGLGIWGGKFRIGTRSEYVVLTLNQTCPRSFMKESFEALL